MLLVAKLRRESYDARGPDCLRRDNRREAENPSGWAGRVFPVKLLALFTERVRARSQPAFPRWNFASGRACVVVVMDAICFWFVDFLDGVESGYLGHDFFPSDDCRAGGQCLGLPGS